jgi:hypothetical protein
MKAQFVLFSFLLSVSISYSQSNYPLIEAGKVWSVANFDPNNGPTTTTSYKFENDTLINGKNYYLTYDCYLDSTLSNWGIYDNIFVREDSLGNVYRLINNTEQLLYNFNMEVGDSIFTGYQIGFQDVYASVDSVDSVLINGNLRKRIIFDSYFNEIWIEGIGSLTHILYPFSKSMSTLWYDLLCVILGGSTVYQNSQFEDCYLYVVGNYDKDNIKLHIKIIPNPLHDRSVVNFLNSSNEIWQMEIVNVTGEIKRSQTITGNQIEIVRHELPPGMYLLRLTSEKDSYIEKLIVE